MALLSISNAKPYVKEKIISEKKLEAITNKIIFRISSPYGVGQKNQNVLYHFLNNVRQKKDLLYYGEGARTQDFIHASDIANAVAAALKHKVFGIYNIVSGYSVSMRSLAIMISRLNAAYNGQVHSSGQSDPQEIFRANFSNQKAKAVLGWNPEMPLELGLSEMVKAMAKS